MASRKVPTMLGCSGSLVILSAIPGLRWNEVVFVLIPFDVLLPFLGVERRRRYARFRLAGLFLVFGHNVWSPLPAAIISLLGWIAVIEGGLYLLLPDEAVEGIPEAVNRPSMYLGGGAFTVLVGIYLAGFGFGWW